MDNGLRPSAAPLAADGGLLALLGPPGLPPASPPVPEWLQGPGPQGHTGVVRWWHRNGLTWGEVNLPADDASLAAHTTRAYLDVFDCIQALGTPHLVRVWNVFPRITEALPDGQERYRAFNTARLEAFIRRGFDTGAGSPAATCVGSHDGPLRLWFVASSQAALPLENPRQVPAWRYPSAYGPTPPTFCRGALMPRPGSRPVLWLSGTASIVGHRSMHEGDVAEQTREIARNLQALLAQAEAVGGQAWAPTQLHATAYVRRPEDAATVQAVWQACTHDPRPLTRVQADICRPELAVELEWVGLPLPPHGT